MFPNDPVCRLARILTLHFADAFGNPGHLRQWNPAAIHGMFRGVGLEPVSQENMPLPWWTFGFHHLAVARKA